MGNANPGFRSSFSLACVLLSAGLLCACAGRYPAIDGPFGPPPDPAIRTILDAGGSLTLPDSASAPQDAIAIAVGPSQRWGDVSKAVRSSATGSERNLFIRVADPQGRPRWLALSLQGRLTGPLYDELSTQLVADEHILLLDEPGGVLTIQHRGRTLSIQAVPSVLEKLLTERGELYFPLGEKPSRAELPVVLRATGEVRFGSLAGVLAVCRNAGFDNLLLHFPASP